jgi:hypothetical protein
MDKSYFKVYGQKRTGTNYISSTILHNFMNTKVFMNVGGWKHGKLIKVPDETNLLNTVDEYTKNNTNINNTINLFRHRKVNFIVTIKNPYMWISSISKFENKQLTSKYVTKKINLWNKVYSNYKKYIMKGKAYLIKYETFLQNPHDELDKLKKTFNLNTKNKVYVLEKKKLCPNTDHSIGLCLDIIFNESYYMNPDINKILTKNTIKIINDNIDTSLMDFYQYKLEKT